MACGHYYHMPCVSQWLLQGKTNAVCLLDMSNNLQKLRRQKAVARWVQDSYNSGYMCSQPPEVRVSRISLEQRRRQPPPPLLAAPPAALLPTKPKPTRKKRQRRLGELPSTDRLPMSVTASRALSVQVQPLMAVLMSPRNLEECSPTNLPEKENGSVQEEEKEVGQKKIQLSIKSLELPETANHPSRGIIRRFPPRIPSSRRMPKRAVSHPLPSFALGCRKISLSPRRSLEPSINLEPN
ncbi:uncharacterized protein LOC142320212 [Lycorma delicatula]|uniref:uncharacterized protein LOC142320212 n=1 Tax=Lycorma delicatula TaxID=130591 RepID=UPI003F510F98